MWNFADPRHFHVLVDVASCYLNLSITKIEQVEGNNFGTTYALRLRKMTQASYGLLKKFHAAFLTLVLHSMATERAVSHCSNVKTSGRSSLLPETINSIMQISLNGKGTAHFDSRPALHEFLSSKEMRNREPSKEVCKQREFVKHFSESF